MGQRLTCPGLKSWIVLFKTFNRVLWKPKVHQKLFVLLSINYHHLFFSRKQLSSILLTITVLLFWGVFLVIFKNCCLL